MPSHLYGAHVCVLRKGAPTIAHEPVLFLHGSTFPSALAFDFDMDGMSWMDQLASTGREVYALDFLGYGHSDRYPEMQDGAAYPVGRAEQVVKDVARVVDWILERTGKPSLTLIGHSWGGSVAALYAGQFGAKVGRLILFAALTRRNEGSARDTILRSHDQMTPVQRIGAMQSLCPQPSDTVLASEIFTTWGAAWLATDGSRMNAGDGYVRFPSGPSQDIDDMLHDASYWDPGRIMSPVLLVRGEWDQYPSHEDYSALYESLVHAPIKKYSVVERGTHVMHLESARFELYKSVADFITVVSPDDG